MNRQADAIAADVRRCAVCKIDLKGRFVYVDDKTASLLGCSQEQLFGKPIRKFIDESQHDLLTQLTSQRSRFESYFETTCLTLVNRNGKRINAIVVFSLNFIAGNPANYQLILDVQGAHSLELSVKHAANEFEILKELAALAAQPDWNRAISLLQKSATGSSVGLYRIEAESLQLVTTATSCATSQDAFDAMPKPGPLHHLVAKTNERYSHTDQYSVQRAIELGGSAPNELIEPIIIGGESWLVRIIYDGNAAKSDISQEGSNTLHLLKLIPGLMAAGQTVEEQQNADCKTLSIKQFRQMINLGSLRSQVDNLQAELAELDSLISFSVIEEKMQPTDLTDLCQEVINELLSSDQKRKLDCQLPTLVNIETCRKRLKQALSNVLQFGISQVGTDTLSIRFSCDKKSSTLMLRIQFPGLSSKSADQIGALENGQESTSGLSQFSDSNHLNRARSLLSSFGGDLTVEITKRGRPIISISLPGTVLPAPAAKRKS